MTIQVCIGSACHLRGSYDVKRTFENLIAQHGLGDRVQLQAAIERQDFERAAVLRDLIRSLEAQAQL